MKPYRLIRRANLWRFTVWSHPRGPKITGCRKPWKMRGICNNAVWNKLPHWTLIETDEVKTFTLSPKWNICNLLVESSQKLSTSNLNVTWSTSNVCFNGCDPVLELAVIIDFYIFPIKVLWVFHGSSRTPAMFLCLAHKYITNIGCYFYPHVFRYFIWTRKFYFPLILFYSTKFVSLCTLYLSPYVSFTISKFLQCPREPVLYFISINSIYQ